VKLAPQQQAALDAACGWYQTAVAKDQLVFHVFGYAGTGKTTIAKQFAEMVDGRVIFAAYTGKAASVLRQKGCQGADTIHSLIYLPSSKSVARLRELQTEYIREEQGDNRPRVLASLKAEIKLEQDNVKRPSFSINHQSALKDAKLLIVDEVSMVNRQMAEDLLSFGVPLLVLGDPAQLPPVKGGGHFTNVKPEVLLTEVHRQAAGSPVLSLATRVREGRGLGTSDLVVPKGRLQIADLAKFDQVLVGTHRSRKHVNRKMREHLKFPSELPVSGDRIICTRNDKDTGLLNGSQWHVLDAQPDPDTGRLELYIKSVDTGNQMRVDAHLQPFLGEEIPFWDIRQAQCFEYAYAMTVHKAQGSQFDSVALIDESHKFPQHQRRAWLYTGITRAARDLTIIR